MVENAGTVTGEMRAESTGMVTGRAFPKVSIILLNLNAYKDTSECLGSLAEVRYPNFEVIVVDNGSTDDSSERLQNEFPCIKALRSEENVGFAEGNNLGIRQALEDGADYVLLLNNDTVVDPDFLTHLIKMGEANPRIGVLGPKIFYFSDPARIWYAGGKVGYLTARCQHLGLGKLDGDGKFMQPAETFFVTGCALTVKAGVIREVGLLDPGLFVYWEDADFCSRVREAGYQCMFVPEARIWHKIARTTGSRSAFSLYLSTRNQLTWVARHFPLHSKIAAFPYALLRRAAIMVYLALKGGPVGAVWAGVQDFFRGEYGPPRAEWLPGRRATGAGPQVVKQSK